MNIELFSMKKKILRVYQELENCLLLYAFLDF